MKKNNLKDIEEVLVVVDMVNGFVKEGPMADSYIGHIVPMIQNMMADYLNQDNAGVFVVKEGHSENACEFNVHPKHCIKGTKEAMLVDELSKLEPYCYEFLKNSTSAIWAKEFIETIKLLLQNPKFRKVTVVGCCTDICVMDLSIPLKKLFDELNIEVEVIIPTEAVETFNIDGIHERDEWNNMAFRFMEQAGIKLVKKLERGK